MLKGYWKCILKYISICYQISSFLSLKQEIKLLSLCSSAPRLRQAAAIAMIHYVWKPNLLSGVTRTNLPVLTATTRKMTELELEQGYSSAAFISLNSCTESSQKAICRGERPPNWKLWKGENARNPFPSKSEDTKEKYSLVRIAEVYSKQSKALFCSSNNPKGKILMKAAWFSDICLPWIDMQEAMSQLKKKHALLSISKKPKHLSSTLP